MKKHACAGFTLLEVLAALTVFLIGVVGVLALLTSGTRLHQSSQNLTAVGDVVEAALLRAERDLELAPILENTGLPENLAPTPLPENPRYRYSWSLKAADPAPPYLLTLELRWMEGGREQTYSAQTVIPRLRPARADVRVAAAQDR